MLKMMKIWRPFCTRGFVSSTPVPPPLEEGRLKGEREEWKNKSIKENRVSLPPVVLPPLLNDSLHTVLSNYAPKVLIKAGETVSNYLVSRDPFSTLPFRYSRHLAIGYAASRAQPVYGTTYRVLNELANIDKEFKPGTMLDFGSGLGTAVWAAHSLWGKSIYEYQTVDTSADMGELARSLRSGGKNWASIMDSSLSTVPTPLTKESIKGVYFRQFLPISNKLTYDLVVSAYSLSELPTSPLLKQVLLALWDKAEKYMVLIEMGNKFGFSLLAQAREILLNHEGAEKNQCHIVAPCTHDLECPMAKREKLCRFAQRVDIPFSKYQYCRSKGFFIEGFSYLIIKRGQRPPPLSEDEAPCRLLEPTKKRTKHTICHFCCPNGRAVRLVFSKRKNRALLRLARKKKWGDTITVPALLYNSKGLNYDEDNDDKDEYGDDEIEYEDDYELDDDEQDDE